MLPLRPAGLQTEPLHDNRAARFLTVPPCFFFSRPRPPVSDWLFYPRIVFRLSRCPVYFSKKMYLIYQFYKKRPYDARFLSKSRSPACASRSILRQFAQFLLVFLCTSHISMHALHASFHVLSAKLYKNLPRFFESSTKNTAHFVFSVCILEFAKKQ